MLMLSIAILMISVILRPEGPMGGAYSAVQMCLKIVIPSLFPLFVLNRMLISSGAATRFFTRFGKPFAKLFKLPSACASAVVLGFLSGYPTGAKIAKSLYEKELMCDDEFKRLTAFCNNAGPIFITGSVGAGMLHSSKQGIFLLSVHVLSAIAVGIILSFGKTYSPSKEYNPKYERYSAPKLFTESVCSSVSDISFVCGYIIFFGMLMSFVNSETILGKSIYMFSEMTNACKIFSTVKNSSLKLSLISASLGWGGMCVHAQSFSVIRHKKTYLFGKLLQGMLSFAISEILLLFVHF